MFFVLVKMKIHKIPYIENLFNQNSKIVDILVEDKEEQIAPKSRMWKQVIRENVIEDKKNEIEELIAKTEKIEKIVVNKLKEIDDQAKESQRMIEKKLREIDDQAKNGHETVVSNLHEIDSKASKDHKRRKNELQNMMRDFKTFIDQRKGQEKEERCMEVERTIQFMGSLGKIINSLIGLSPGYDISIK